MKINRQSGSAVFYIFIAIALLAALTFAMTRTGGESAVNQASVRVVEELFSQVNMIRSAVQQCTLEYPDGGRIASNPNTPYPLNPDSEDNPHGQAADNSIRNLTCSGAPGAEAGMFQADNNQGRVLSPPPAGFSEWVYANDANGVYLQITGPADAVATNSLTQLMGRFGACQADLNYAGCGDRCFTVWIKRNSCP